MTDQEIRKVFDHQERACRSLGSDFVGRLCGLCAERLQKGDPISDAILNWQGDASGTGDSVPLRLMGALHALVRADKNSELAGVYPPHHSNVTVDDLWRAVSNSFTTHNDFILDRLKGPPQTNEVRRAAATMALFLEVGRQTGLPLILSEVGASAGINLHLDDFHIQLGDRHVGEASSSVKLSPKWYGNPAPEGKLEIVSRAGCDLIPVDPGLFEDRERLMSFIWADQQDRIERTAAALEIAANKTLRVEKADAIDWLARRVTKPHEGSAHVIYSTIAWQYLPKGAQMRGEEIIRTAGDRATKEAPLAWVMMEGDGEKPGAGLSMTLWPGAQTHTVGRTDYHGRWIDWVGWPE
jgi:hypothetical protein